MWEFLFLLFVLWAATRTFPAQSPPPLPPPAFFFSPKPTRREMRLDRKRLHLVVFTLFILVAMAVAALIAAALSLG